MKGDKGRPRTREAKVKYPEFRDRLRAAMERLGVNRSEMAKKLGTTDATFGNYYNGERIPAIPEYQKIICETLNVSWEWLAYGTSKKEEPGEIRQIRMIQIPAEDLKDLENVSKLWERLKKYFPD